MRHLTAAEARELAADGKRTKDSVCETIKIMAKAGHNYAVIETDAIYNPKEQKTYWESLGYEVELNKHFSINW